MNSVYVQLIKLILVHLSIQTETTADDKALVFLQIAQDASRAFEEIKGQPIDESLLRQQDRV